MRCPKCGSANARYKQRREDFGKTREKKFKRTDFTIICKEKCEEVK